jgi:hypothetical protein
MSRHYSKVLVELPDNPSDPPYAVVSIDCATCGQSELKIHVAHLGTVLRALSGTVDSLHDDGFHDVITPYFIPSNEENKRKVREHLNREFPGWVVGRQKKPGRA